MCYESINNLKRNKGIMFKKRYLITALSILLLIACSDTLWDELPSPISTFITTYYPNSGISNYKEENNTYYVKIKNGASLVFDSNYDWTQINGNGVPIPKIFIFNEMPKIYQYLEARELTSDLMEAKNEPRNIILTFTDFRLEYIKETGDIRTYTEKPDA